MQLVKKLSLCIFLLVVVFKVTAQPGTRQPISVYPDYSDKKKNDKSGMRHDAFELASKINIGWNLGNSLEVPGDETAWGNPKVTKAFIDSVKKAGFNAVRIPCAWDSYIEDQATCKIKASWLARVKEVVDYCVKDDMYVIINIHWDGGWLENHPVRTSQVQINTKQKALWQQIAVYFRDYDEHLLFAGTNEVHVDGTPTDENFDAQMSFNQTFVHAVRSTGGRNAYRNLLVQSYNTNIDLAVSKLVMPHDNVDRRLITEVHYYDPWDFCGLEKNEAWATMKFLWGTKFAQYGPISDRGQEDYVKAQFQKMKVNFVDKGYPVMLGEFGAITRPSLTGADLEHHLASRAYFFEYIVEQAKDNGIVPFFWDNGSGVFNRSNGSVSDKQALTGLMKGAAAGKYPY